MRVLTAWIVFFSLSLGISQEVKAQEFISLSQAESPGAPVQDLSWEEREFERIMRLREIHAGTRPLVHPPVFFTTPLFIVPQVIHHPPIFCSGVRCFSGSRIIIIERRNKTSKDRK